MGKKDKKKGKGAEKTAFKTEKKALNKLKKSLAAKGEDEIEKLILQCQEKSKKEFGEELCTQPSPRSGFSFCTHPDKDEIVMFGGEYYNGSQTTMYNELYFYNLKKGQWTILHTPENPPPRCSHQAVTVPQLGGQMWVFGGEFASPSRSNFYHYKDLWVFLFNEKKWYQVKAPGAPSARSGHRMVMSQKQLIIFGGFQETVSEYKYFNDIHLFNLETYQWSKIEAAGKIPSPRSGCQMAALTDGRVLVCGGYCREKVKKDVDKGITFTDMYYLHLDERTDPPKWKWNQIKPAGIPPSARSGFSLAVGPNNHAYAFGGVQDEDPDEESLTSTFYNDLYLLELETGQWHPVTLQGKESSDVKKGRRKTKGIEEQLDEEEEVMEILENAQISEPLVKTYEDDVFSIKIGPQIPDEPKACSSIIHKSSAAVFQPRPRMNACLAIKKGMLYLYGGLYEDEDRQLTLSDFYKFDIHKSKWQTIIPFSSECLEWIESEESSTENDEDTDDSSNSFEEMDTL